MADKLRQYIRQNFGKILFITIFLIMPLLMSWYGRIVLLIILISLLRPAWFGWLYDSRPVEDSIGRYFTPLLLALLFAMGERMRLAGGSS